MIFVHFTRLLGVLWKSLSEFEFGGEFGESKDFFWEHIWSCDLRSAGRRTEFALVTSLLILRTFSRNSSFRIPFYCSLSYGLWSGFINSPPFSFFKLRKEKPTKRPGAVTWADVMPLMWYHLSSGGISGITSEVLHQWYHIRGITWAVLHQLYHNRGITSVVSHQLYHMRGITSVVSQQRYYISCITSEVSLERWRYQCDFPAPSLAPT